MQQYDRNAFEGGDGGDDAAEDDGDGDEEYTDGPSGGGGQSAIHMDLFYNYNDHE
jgi:hypothetical protein